MKLRIRTSAILLAQVACHSIRLSYSLVVVLPLVSIFVFRVSKFRLFRDYANMKSTTLAVGLVLQNAAAVQLSNMMRILPQYVGEWRLLVSGSLVLWPEYPQSASGTLDGIF